MKGKLLKMALAMMLASGTVAGLPAVNVPKAQAAAELPQSTAELVDRMVSAYESLSEEEKTEIQETRDAISELLFDAPDDSAQAAVEPLLDIINTKLIEEELQVIDAEEAVRMMASIVYHFVLTTDRETQIEVLNYWRTDADNREFFNRIGEPAGVSLDGPDGLDIDSFTLFAEALIEQLVNDSSLWLDAAGYLLSERSDEDSTAFREGLKAGLASALTNVMGMDLKLSTVLETYAGDSAADLVQAVASAYVSLTELYDSDMEAHVAIIKAVAFSGVDEPTAATSSDGSELTLELSVMGVPIPSFLVEWTILDGDEQITNDDHDNVFELANPAPLTEYTATVQARAADFNATLVEAYEIAMQYTPASSDNDDVDDNGTPGNTGGNGGSGGSGGSSAPQEIADQIRDAVEQAQQAPPAERASIIKETVTAVKETLKGLSKVDLSSSVTVTSGRGTANVNLNTVRDQIAAIQQQSAQLNQTLQGLNPNAVVKPTLTLDLGAVNAPGVTVPIAKEILDAALEAGIGSVAVVVNGVTVDFDPSVFSESTTLDIASLSDEEAKNVTDLPLASSVYDITFTSGGGEVEQFEVPVQLEIPVQTSGRNPAFLTVGKIVDGQIVNYGGKVVNGVIRVSRTSFSKYVVVENRVSFNDTASVTNWAGLPIQSVAAKGIVEGRGEGVYDPNDNVTRAEFAKMITKALGIEGTTGTETFADVNNGDWFQPYVAAVQKWGIANGRTNTQFAPNENITRAEMATMIARALEQVNDVQSFADASDVLGRFDDAGEIHVSLQQGVAFAADQGIVNGLPDGSFAPNSFTTRAEAAVMIYRVLNLEE